VLLVRRQYRRALVALHALLLLIANDEQQTPTGFQKRRNLSWEHLQCASVLAMAKVDLPTVLDDWPTLEVSLNELVYVTLAACWTENPPQALDAGLMARELGALIDSLPPVTAKPVDAGVLADRLDTIEMLGKHTGQSWQGHARA
jgi:hypothetical protein